MQRGQSLIIQRNDKLGHLDQFCRTCDYFHIQLPHLDLQTCSKFLYTLFCKNTIIATVALVIKDTFAPQFTSIQSIVDSFDLLEIVAYSY